MSPPVPAPARTASVVVVSKDEPALAGTLDSLAVQARRAVASLLEDVEVVVVDASSGRLDEVRSARDWVRWIDYHPPPGARVTIAQQRNVGVRASHGDIVVFTDCGCEPADDWLVRLLAPLLAGGERMACGRTGAAGPVDPYYAPARTARGSDYLSECPTVNLALRREVFDEVGLFDESFEYGSDTDFSWRAVAHGVQIRYVPDAVVLHDWGTRRRQVRRSYLYGKARARLLAKHVLGRGGRTAPRRQLGEQDLVALAYPLFLLGLPLAARRRSYLLLLAVPLWRNRRHAPVAAVVDHLALGAGVLAGAGELAWRR